MRSLKSQHGYFALPQHAKAWFLLSVCVLLPVEIYFVVSNEWLWRPPKPIGDGLEYENIAFELWQGRGFRIDSQDPTWRSLYEGHDEYELLMSAPARDLVATGRPPLLPLVIAAAYTCLGRNSIAFAAVRIMAALSIALSGAIAVAVTSRILKKNRIAAVVGCLATLLLAVTNRTLRSYSTDFLTEPWALLFTQCFIAWIFFRLMDAPCGTNARNGLTIRLLIAGFLLGIMILFRSLFVLWLPGVALLLLVTLDGGWQTRMKGVATVMMGVGTLCAPWWIHNVVSLRAMMPLGTQGPITLLGGYCDQSLQAGGDWQYEPEQRLREQMAAEPDYTQAIDDTAREVMIANRARSVVSSWVAEHWQQLPQLAVQRVVTHWNPYTGRSLAWKLLILLGLACVALHSRRYAVWCWGLPIVSTILAALLYTTGGRFLVPLYGLLYSIAGCGVGFAWSWMVRRMAKLSSEFR